jgi:hypothetical protein
MSDLTPWLREWPWRPGRLDVRRIQASDGRLVLQVRLELGILQLEADGRPDGGDFRQATTALDWFQGQPDADVDAEGVAVLAAEMAQFRQRAMACALIEDWPRAQRDAQHNLDVLDLIAARAQDAPARRRFETWRPHEQATLARAASALALASGRRDLARAALDAGLRQVQATMARLGRSDDAGQCPETALLRALLDALTLKLPGSQRLELQQRLDDAVRAENFELAAILRDELRQMEGEAR